MATTMLNTRPAQSSDYATRSPSVAEHLLFEVKRFIVGQDIVLERLLVALLARGHVLLEGVPGLAKTATIKSLAQLVGGTAAVPMPCDLPTSPCCTK